MTRSKMTHMSAKLCTTLFGRGTALFSYSSSTQIHRPPGAERNSAKLNIQHSGKPSHSSQSLPTAWVWDAQRTFFSFPNFKFVLQLGSQNSLGIRYPGPQRNILCKGSIPASPQKKLAYLTQAHHLFLHGCCKKKLGYFLSMHS